MLETGRRLSLIRQKPSSIARLEAVECSLGWMNHRPTFLCLSKTILDWSCTDENHERTSNDRILLTKKKEKEYSRRWEKKKKSERSGNRTSCSRAIVFSLFFYCSYTPLSSLCVNYFSLIMFLFETCPKVRKKKKKKKNIRRI